jgi:hypothetical protein
MSKSVDELLTEELGAVGRVAGRLGGGMSGGSGGSVGARFAARYLPTCSYEQQVDIAQHPVAVLTRLLGFLASQGRMMSEGDADTAQFPSVSYVLGSGFLRMNPTIVRIEVLHAGADACTLLVSGSAKEGLITQRSAKKAVDRVLAFLQAID